MDSTDRIAQANEYVREKMLFDARLAAVLNSLKPELMERFADFYCAIFEDGALSRKVKELMFVSTAVSYRSPMCLIHARAAVEAGATDDEFFEAVAVGTVMAGVVPGGPGIPYAFPYAIKVLEIVEKYRAGEPWEYAQPPEFRM